MSRWRSVLRDYYQLAKPRIVFLILVTTVAGMWLAAGGPPAPGIVGWTLLGTALAAAGGGVLNCYVDRDLDRLMERTRHRPLPAGRVSPRAALAYGMALSAAGPAVLALRVNGLAAALALAGTLYYVLVYSVWLKRRTPQNVVIGGAAGAVGPLIGWAAVTGRLDLPAWILFLVVFLWTPPHFWALSLFAQEDYRRAGLPMLPVVRGEGETRRQIALYSLALVPVTLTLTPLGVTGPLYLAAALLLGGVFAALALRLWRRPERGLDRRLFAYSIAYLALLFAAVVGDAR